MEKFIQGCTLDCYDLCKFEVYKENGKVVKIVGDRQNSFTDGFICIKGIKHVERLYHKDRLISPLLKVDGKFQEITFETALNLLKNRLEEYKKESTLSVIRYSESGSGGFLKGIEEIFFNFYGGVTTSKGGTCWAAGTAAQNYDFGDRRTNSIEDLSSAKIIIFWGRNPANTSIHLFRKALKGKETGSKIITIDPRVNETSKIADLHIDIEPGTDGALAIAITKYIVDNHLEDRDFIDEHVVGYSQYKKYLSTLSMSDLLEECGVSFETMEKLAKLFLKKSVSIFIGYGMQKYFGGGNSVRAIDALMAFTGNIGESGSGSFYANRIYPQILNRDPFESSRWSKKSREYWVADFANFINRSVVSNTDPVKAIFISRCNPLNQYPNLNATMDAFSKIEFKVCFDMFMTDTAKNCDLVIPVTNTLESEDLIYSSMHNPTLIYNEKVVEPLNPLMDEYYFFCELAKIMGMKNYPQVEKREYISKILQPLNITIEDLKRKDFDFSKNSVAWANKKFSTPSHKIEVYSMAAEKDNQSPHPVYISKKNTHEEYPLRLLTPHYRDSLFSQHFMDLSGISKLFVSKEIMKNHYDGEKVELSSQFGKIICTIHCDETLRDHIAYMFVGWNHKHGNPNFLTKSGSSDMGGQITYNETFIKISKLS